MPRLRQIKLFDKDGSVTGVGKSMGLGAVRKIAQSQIDKNTEFKRHTLNISTTVDSTGTCTSLSTIGQGDSSTTRDGEKIVLRKLKLRYNVLPADSTNLVRFIIFRWMPNDNDHVPVPADVLLNVGDSSAPLSSYQPQFRDLIKVYYDKVVPVDTTSVTQRYHTINLSKKLGLHKTVYQGSNTYGSKNLWMLAISDSDGVSHPSYRMYGLLRFTDA